MPTVLIATHATTAGVRPQEGGASASRVVLTPEGEFHVKFVGLGGEGLHGPMNELLGNRLLEALGCVRPRLAVIRIPGALRLADAELGAAGSEFGIGIERIPGATDLGDPAAIADAAERAPAAEIFAQFLMLTWLQNTDHESHNYLQVGDRVIAIDFAASPADAVWYGGQLSENRAGHGLRGRVDQMAHDERSGVISSMTSLDREAIREMLEDAPDAWASNEARDYVASELERVGRALVADYA